MRICLHNGSNTSGVMFFTLCLLDYLFVLDLKKNLVYVSCLVEHGLTV